MSAASAPISPARFAAALPDLPLSGLHAKAAELHNSLSHLQSSNAQLAPFAEPASEDYDDVCAKSIRENEVVMRQMNHRLFLLKCEVEGRGALWVWGPLDKMAGWDWVSEAANRGAERNCGGGSHADHGADSQSTQDVQGSTLNGNGNGNGQQDSQRQSGRLTDEELARRIREQMGEDEDEDGMHL